MASALTAELTHLLEGSEETLEGLSEWRGTLGKPQQGVPSFDMAPVVTTDVYDRMLGKIGVLEPEQGSKVIRAYLIAKLLPRHVRWLVADIVRRGGLTPEPDPHPDMNAYRRRLCPRS